ncbi:cation:proton antiporter [Vulgatibacter sp.]|uniref:cation:proton antiporter n=1 Tax=Vulgatibacter sp. TaxID=1971226 RepID=UPI003562F113
MRRILVLLLVFSPAVGAAVEASADAGGHADPVAHEVAVLAIVLAAAVLGGDLATRFKQPAVLGELLAGVVLGNLDLLGIGLFEPIASDAFVDMLARLGVLFLLFEVGLESTVGEMRQVGGTALLVAVAGVAAPFALGWGVSAWLLPDAGLYVHLFLGATLCATSVGITARVLQDIGKSQTAEAKVILGAAVIDDVLGLVLLAVVTGIISAADRGGAVSLFDVGWTLLKAVLFLLGALLLGVKIAPRLFSFASRLRSRGVLLVTGLLVLFVMSWAANLIGLAPIVGAFAAGLILEDVHYRDFLDRGEHTLEELIHPIAGFLVPVFFVLMGMRTDLAAFGQSAVLGLAAALTVVGIAGKLACGLGVIGKPLDKLTIGVGMVPRGEVGLIFANIGLALTVGGQRIVSPPVFSAIVVVVMVTTMVTPPALKWSIGRAEARTP